MLYLVQSLVILSWYSMKFKEYVLIKTGQEGSLDVPIGEDTSPVDIDDAKVSAEDRHRVLENRALRSFLLKTEMPEEIQHELRDEKIRQLQNLLFGTGAVAGGIGLGVAGAKGFSKKDIIADKVKNFFHGLLRAGRS